jgi:uncharacterized membrane protein YhhN
MLRVKYLLTPLRTAINLSFVVLAVDMGGMNTYRMLILSALIASLIADVMLMLVVERMTIYGIIYFLGAHLIYIFAFADGYSFAPWHIGFAALLLCAIIVFDTKVGKSNKKLRPLLLLYSLALCSAGFFAVSGLPGGGTARIARAAGAVLFIVSDIFFGINNFRKPIKHSSVITWAAYAPAQFLFALSCF